MSFFSQFKRDLGPGRIFKKKISNSDISKGRNSFDGTIDDLLEIVRRLQNQFDILRRDIPCTQQLGLAQIRFYHSSSSIKSYFESSNITRFSFISSLQVTRT